MKNFYTLILSIAIYITAMAQGTWTQKANFPGAKRWGSSSFSIGAKGYLGCGYDGSVNYSDFWEYDPAANVWTQKASMSLVRRAACAFAINGKGYITGGIPASGSFLTDTWEYDPTSNSWNAKANFPGAGRYGAASFAIGNKGYVCCGNEGSASGPFTNELWEFDPSSNSWNAKANFTGNARYGMSYSCFVIGTKGYVGLGGDASTQYTDFYAYDQSANSWSQVANYPGSGKGYCCGFGTCFKGFMGTGHVSSTVYSDFWQYDDASNTWTQVANFGGGGRWLMVSCVINGKAYTGTGYDFTNYYNDWWQYTCIDDAVNEIDADKLISVYPNPFSTQTTLHSDIALHNASISVCNSVGQTVTEIKNISGQTIVLHCDDLPGGIYFVRIKTGSKIFTKKLVITEK
jgi:N-acetylneuraminic acid mutarotase